MCSPLVKFLTKLNEKPVFLHTTLIVGVISYSCLGGFVFRALESETHMKKVRTEFEERIDCFTTTIANASEKQMLSTGALNNSWTARAVFVKCVMDREELDDWDFVGSALFGFGIVTTLGIGRLAPVTAAGRILTIFFGMCGIPLTMLVLANMGKGINDSSVSMRQKIADYRKRKRREKGLEDEDEKDGGDMMEPTGLLVLAAFLMYIILGSCLLTAIHENMDFVTGLYFTFLSLTALEFRALVPKDVKYLPLILTYICCGIAITTIAIDVGSDYLKRLHFLGKKIENTKNVAIWFGGKKIFVQDLVDSVCDRCGVDPKTMVNLDIDQVVGKAIDVQEGTCPPWAHRRQAIADGNNLPPIDTDVSSDSDTSDAESGRRRRRGNGSSFDRKASLVSAVDVPPLPPSYSSYIQAYASEHAVRTAPPHPPPHPHDADEEEDDDETETTRLLVTHDATQETLVPHENPYQPLLLDVFVVEDCLVALEPAPTIVSALVEYVEPCVALQPVTFEYLPVTTPDEPEHHLSSPESVLSECHLTEVDVQLTPLEPAPTVMPAVQVLEYLEPECSEPEADQRLSSPEEEPSTSSEPPRVVPPKRPKKTKPKFDFRLSADFSKEREASKNDPHALLQLYQREWGKVDKFMQPLTRAPRSHSKADIFVGTLRPASAAGTDDPGDHQDYEKTGGGSGGVSASGSAQQLATVDEVEGAGTEGQAKERPPQRSMSTVSSIGASSALAAAGLMTARGRKTATSGGGAGGVGGVAQKQSQGASEAGGRQGRLRPPAQTPRSDSAKRHSKS